MSEIISLPPPNPSERIPDMFIAMQKLPLIPYPDFAEISPETTGNYTERGIDGLLEDIALLPPVEDREILINPEHRPELTKNLRSFDQKGIGWKIHLNFDAEDGAIVKKISDSLTLLKDRDAVGHFKVGHGGGKAAGAPGKESTVYVGSRDKTNLVAQYLSEVFVDCLTEPDADALKTDMVIAPRVIARFDPVDEEFLQYGPNGFPMPASDQHTGWICMPRGTTEQENARTGDYVHQQSYALQRLTEKYGDFFTGSQEALGPIVQPVIHDPRITSTS